MTAKELQLYIVANMLNFVIVWKAQSGEHLGKWMVDVAFKEGLKGDRDTGLVNARGAYKSFRSLDTAQSFLSGVGCHNFIVQNEGLAGRSF